MSFGALAWAIKQRTTKATDKLLLLGLADRYNDDDRVVWPSQKWLEDFSGLDRKTVIAGLARLEEAGLMRDTGDRVGKTRQVKVVQIAYDFWEPAKDTESGTLTGNGPAFPGERSRNRDTEPVKEPTSPKASPSSRRKPASECPDDFWPVPTPGTATAAATHAMGARLPVEVEKFVAHHQTKGNRYINWQQAWTQWAVSNLGGNNHGNRNRQEGREPANPMVRAGLRSEARRRFGGTGPLDAADRGAVAGRIGAHDDRLL